MPKVHIAFDDSQYNPQPGEIWQIVEGGLVEPVPAASGGGGASNLNELDDVVITTPADNEVLAYDNASGDWINQTAAEAGLAVSGHNHDADYAALSHTHAASDVTSGTFANARISQASVTQHQAALTITESQISDLDHYTDTDANAAIDTRVNKAFVDALNIDADTLDGLDSTAFATSGHSHGASAINDLSDVTITTPTDNEVLAYDTTSGDWINQTPAEAGLATSGHDHDADYAALSHTHAASDVTSGTFANARIAQSNVTQHEAALTITESQISDLDHYTSTDFDTDFSGKSTTNLSEGTNLYYTTARANTAIDNRVDKAFVDALNVDADTLDGLDSTAFATSGHSHSAAAINDLSDVVITTPADNEVLAYDNVSGDWINQTAAEAGLAAAGHAHSASDTTSGTFANARISQASVTQHQAALTITESQISDLDHYNSTDFNTDFGTKDLDDIAAGVTNKHFTATDESKLDGIESGATADQTAGEIEAIVNHDNLVGFVANEHVDWTADQGATNIHPNNVTGYSATGHTHTESDITDLDHLTIEEVQDNLGTAFIVAGTDISITYDDTANTLTINSTATGETDHGNLSGLGDDDHTQYLNTTRHDAHDHSSAMASVVLDDLSDVVETTITIGDVLRWNGTNWVNYADSNYAGASHNHDGDYAALSHTHAAGDITSGTFANARIAQSNVTQHQAALTITESQISDLDHYTNTDANAAIDARVDKAFVDALNVDADTLDGLDSTAFATSGHNHDADYVNVGGDTMTGELTVKAPASPGIGYTTNGLKYYTSGGASSTEEIRFSEAEGAWGRYNTVLPTFDKFWHEGNMGSGSGMDADLLDGQHASAFAATSHTHTESDITDLGAYPDATGQAASKVAETDGAGGWTFIDTPTGGGGHPHVNTVEISDGSTVQWEVDLEVDGTLSFNFVG